MTSTRSMSREIGTALAVLAIYLLTVLAPLHQARAGQLAFEQLGYVTTEAGWVLCTPAGAVGQDDEIAVTKCPAIGIGKHDLVMPNLAVLPDGLDVVAIANAMPPVVAAFLPAPIAPPSGPRGPPVLV